MKPNYQIMLSGKDPAPLLDRWRGGRAALSGYTNSHRVLELRIDRPETDLTLCITCGDVQHIRGPTKWEGCDLTIERISPDELVLRDRKADFEVRAGVIGAAECQSPYRAKEGQ